MGMDILYFSLTVEEFILKHNTSSGGEDVVWLDDVR